MSSYELWSFKISKYIYIDLILIYLDIIACGNNIAKSFSPSIYSSVTNYVSNIC